MKKIWVILFLCAAVISCAPTNTNTTYRQAQVGQQGQVQTGVIVSMEQVKIEGTSGVGTIAGAVAGAAAGSMLGGSTAVNIIGGTAGAVVGGAVVGGAQKALTSGTSWEFLVKRDDSGAVISVVQSNELNLNVGDHVVLVVVDGVTRIRQKLY